MGQSRRMSLIEAATNTAVGYLLAVATQLVAFPLFHLPTRLSDVFSLGAIFTAVSIARGYLLRRLFEAARPGRRDGYRISPR